MTNSKRLREIVDGKRWSVVRKRFPLVLYCLLLTVYWLPLSGCRSANDTWRQVEETAVLRVGLDPTYPPFAAADSNDLWGLDVDLARALGAELGVSVQFTYFGYDGLYDALLAKKVDVLASALVVDVGRTRDFAYSEPYFNAGEVLVVRAGEGGIADWRDVNGRILAVELGSEGHMEANRWDRRLSDLTVQPYDTPDDALQAVAQGHAAAALVDNASARLYNQQYPEAGLHPLPEPITVKPYALVVRKADSRLLRHLNDALEQLQKSGQLDAILTKWLGE